MLNLFLHSEKPVHHFVWKKESSQKWRYKVLVQPWWPPSRIVLYHLKILVQTVAKTSMVIAIILGMAGRVVLAVVTAAAKATPAVVAAALAVGVVVRSQQHSLSRSGTLANLAFGSGCPKPKLSGCPKLNLSGLMSLLLVLTQPHVGLSSQTAQQGSPEF